MKAKHKMTRDEKEKAWLSITRGLVRTGIDISNCLTIIENMVRTQGAKGSNVYMLPDVRLPIAAEDNGKQDKEHTSRR